MSELDPCPFCGGMFVAQGASRGYISVWCGECSARGPEVKFPEDCMPGPPIDECRALWNRRASRSTVPEAGKAVDETLRAAWEAGRKSYCPAGILKDTERTEREWQRAKSALASVPAPSGAEPVAWQWRALEDGEPRTAWKDPELGDRPGWEALAKRNPEKYATERRALYSVPQAPDAAPQAAPAEAVAETLRKLSELDDAVTYGHDAVKIDSDILATIREAAAALTSLSAERDHYAASELAGVEKARELFRRLEASEAEATSLRRKLEEQEIAEDTASREMQKVTQGLRDRATAAERKLEEHRRALEPFARLLEDESLGGSELDDGWKPLLHRNYTVAEITNGDFRRARTLSGASE